jgi:hypothetical protein
MTDSRDKADRATSRSSAWLYVFYSFCALVLAGVCIPAFSVSSHVLLSGTLAAITCSAISCWAYLTCPRQPFVAKTMCFVLFVIVAFAGLMCAITYVMFVIE